MTDTAGPTVTSSPKVEGNNANNNIAEIQDNLHGDTRVAQSETHRCGNECKGTCKILTPREIALRAYNELYQLYKEELFCDAVLRTEDGGRFPVHRIALCGDSDYFRALFTTNLHQRKRDILIQGISSEMLKLLLEFMYSRKIIIGEDNVTSILDAADYLGIVSLKSSCCEFIESQIDPSNCIGIRTFARAMFCPELEQAAHQYLMRNFVEVSRVSEEMLELSLEEALAVFGHDELNVKNEEFVWEASIRWIDFDAEVRKKHIVELLMQVRTGLMETQYFMEHVKDHPYVHGNDGCRPIVIETLRFLYDLEVITERDGEIPTPNIARPRIPHEVLFAIGGWSGGSPTNYIETYDTRADRWIRVEEVDTTGPRAYHGTVAIGQDIIVVGGFDGVDYFNSCRAFNASEKKWRNLSVMHCRRCYVSVALLNNKYLYAMGGFDGHHRQNTAERYDPDLNQWTMIAPMNAQRSDASATTLGGKIYITGGFNGTECLNSAECYCPITNQWTLIAPMRNRRSGVSCIAYHESVYVIGGFNGISRMCSGEKYNPVTNVWNPIPDMYNPRSNFAIEVIDDMIFCIGGFNGVTTIYHVECFDEKTNEWFEATDMNIFRSALSSSVILGLPNIYDFIHQHRERLMEEKRQRLLVLQQQRPT